MKLAIFSPYGLLHKESGILYLLSNYLGKSGAEVTQLRCDGALPACGRDPNGGAVRSPFQCARCLNEQHALSSWAGARMRDISSEIVTEDIVKASEWIQSVLIGDLERVEFRGVNLWSACRLELLSRWEDLQIKALDSHQELDVRTVYASYVRTAIASERFITAWKPTIAFVTAAQDPLASAFLAQARLAALDVAVFGYDAQEDSILVEYLPTGETYETKLVLEGITTMRSDPRTWSPEVTSMVHEILTLLGCPPDKVL